jgi:hypothetical protein
MSTSTRPRASLDVEKRDIPGVTSRAQIMYGGFVQNVGLFASPTITMVAFLALITALVVAQEATKNTKAKGSASLRNAKRDALWSAMQSLVSYTQVLADSMTAGNAISLIETAGLVVAGTAARVKAVLTAELMAASGTVYLEANRTVLVGKANANKQVTFNWQCSTDGKTWTNAAATPYASTEVPGLTLMTAYSFRVSVTVAKVAGPWSQAVTLLVH